MCKQRNLYRFTSQDVGAALNDRTSVRYEMAHFFVDELVSSANAVSFYTFIFIAVLFAMRSVLIKTFTEVMFPVYDDAEDAKEVEEEKVTERMLSSTSQFLKPMLCCCSCCRRKPPVDDVKPSGSSSI